MVWAPSVIFPWCVTIVEQAGGSVGFITTLFLFYLPSNLYDPANGLELKGMQTCQHWISVMSFQLCRFWKPKSVALGHSWRCQWPQSQLFLLMWCREALLDFHAFSNHNFRVTKPWQLCLRTSEFRLMSRPRQRCLHFWIYSIPRQKCTTRRIHDPSKDSTCTSSSPLSELLLMEGINNSFEKLVCLKNENTDFVLMDALLNGKISSIG